MALNSTDRLNKIQTLINTKKLIDVAYSSFVDHTPIKTGNARHHTLKTDTEILASYPYAKRLDNGWSKQSPNGMVKPTIATIRDYIKKTLG